jgi:hypothetical protein
MTPESLRPKGTVEVTCSHVGCGLSWWLGPLDPRIHGPHDCGGNHGERRILDRQLARVRIRHGFIWGRMQSLVPPKPDDHPCHFDAATAKVHFTRRDGQGWGTLTWTSFDEIASAHPDEIAKRILWEGSPEGDDTVPPGQVRLVGYKDLGTGRIRRYAVVQCSRCQGTIYVDYDEPGHRPSSHAVGTYGDGVPPTAPTPPWACSYTCESAGLGHLYGSPQPCAYVRNPIIDTMLPWTVWSYDHGAGVAALLFDPIGNRYGLLLAQPLDTPLFWELMGRTLWGSPDELRLHLKKNWASTHRGAVGEVLDTLALDSN